MTEQNICENCEKKLKDNEEIFEINDKYVCQNCMELSNERAEMLCEDELRCNINEVGSK